jgi:hypothetical protein
MVIVKTTEPEAQTVQASPVKRGVITSLEVEQYIKGTSTTRSLYLMEINGQPPVLIALTPVTTDPAEALAILAAQKK